MLADLLIAGLTGVDLADAEGDHAVGGQRQGQAPAVQVHYLVDGERGIDLLGVPLRIDDDVHLLDHVNESSTNPGSGAREGFIVESLEGDRAFRSEASSERAKNAQEEEGKSTKEDEGADKERKATMMMIRMRTMGRKRGRFF